MSQYFGGLRIDNFKRQYSSFSGAFNPKSINIDDGGKIVLPASALDELARMNIVWPIMFKITNEKKNISTHCGVLEFSAEEGKMYMPFWMHEYLQLQPGQIVKVMNATLPKGTFVKLRPQQKAFIEISDPKTVLEQKLRNYSCLSKGDTIMINHIGKYYCIDILEVHCAKGQCDAISIVETDVKVEFERPLDMPPSPLPGEKPKQSSTSFPTNNASTTDTSLIGKSKVDNEKIMENDEATSMEPSFKAFSGYGRRLDGKKSSSSSTSSLSTTTTTTSSLSSSSSPPLSSSSAITNKHERHEGGMKTPTSASNKDGSLVFGAKTSSWRKKREESLKAEQNQQKKDEQVQKFVAFGGKGKSLK